MCIYVPTDMSFVLSAFSEVDGLMLNKAIIRYT